MGYQNVGTPRFYINLPLYLLNTEYSAGWSLSELHIKYFQMNPTRQLVNSGASPRSPNVAPITYCAWLSHNANSAFYGEWQNEDGSDPNAIGSNDGGVDLVNCPLPTIGNGVLPTLAGFSIVTFDDDIDHDYFSAVINKANGDLSTDVLVGAVSIGSYFDMPVSPDLSLSMSHEYGGISKSKSVSGSTYTNENWSKPPKWGDLEAWELPRPYHALYNPDSEDWFYGGYRYSGRRSWDLSFSYISDTDLEPRNYTGLKPDGLINDDNWFQNVLYYTMGGHLPFIFCPDSSIDYVVGLGETFPFQIPPRVPEFAICRFDMNSFQREQVANNVYNMKVKIVESW